MLKSKIHRATITQADLNYEGSVTLPPELLKRANFRVSEAVHVRNVTNGNRFETYTILGKPGSTDICINGAAAHLAKPGDLVIIASFAHYDEKELENYKPITVFVDANNRIKEVRDEVLGS